MRDIVEARSLGPYRLWLRFDDGAEGTVDIAGLVRFDGVFAPLSDATVFAAVTVDRELGTVRWPNGADIDPDVLYSEATGKPLPGADEQRGARA